MGIKTIYIDDLTGEETPTKLKVWKVEFDGDTYEVEVTDSTKTLVKARVKALLSEGSLAKEKPKGTRTPAVDLGNHTQTEVREWANKNGLKVNPKGTLTNEVKTKFLAAH